MAIVALLVVVAIGVIVFAPEHHHDEELPSPTFTADVFGRVSLPEEGTLPELRNDIDLSFEAFTFCMASLDVEVSVLYDRVAGEYLFGFDADRMDKDELVELLDADPDVDTCFASHLDGLGMLIEPADAES